MSVRVINEKLKVCDDFKTKKRDSDKGRVLSDEGEGSDAVISIKTWRSLDSELDIIRSERCINNDFDKG